MTGLAIEKLEKVGFMTLEGGSTCTWRIWWRRRD